jgi:hypothetical protein
MWQLGVYDIHSRSLFPYAIASVCSLWRDVIDVHCDFCRLDACADYVSDPIGCFMVWRSTTPGRDNQDEFRPPCG